MKLLNFFKNDEELLEEINGLAKENDTIQEEKNQAELKIQSLKSQIVEIQSRYLKILELKSEQFDLYLKYQTQCEEMQKEKREFKKEIAQLKEQLTEMENKNNELEKENKKIERKLKKFEKAE